MYIAYYITYNIKLFLYIVITYSAVVVKSAEGIRYIIYKIKYFSRVFIFLNYNLKSKLNHLKIFMWWIFKKLISQNFLNVQLAQGIRYLLRSNHRIYAVYHRISSITALHFFIYFIYLFNALRTLCGFWIYTRLATTLYI